jgi:hypothetical protein
MTSRPSGLSKHLLGVENPGLQGRTDQAVQGGSAHPYSSRPGLGPHFLEEPARVVLDTRSPIGPGRGLQALSERTSRKTRAPERSRSRVAVISTTVCCRAMSRSRASPAGAGSRSNSSR